MVLLNQATRELTAKIVYYGPGLCGKTSNLQFIYESLDESQRGKMLSLATDTDRTLFFDFMPMELGTIRNFKVRVQLYTVPGQVFYEETRKRVLKGADGIVFVADSQRTMREPNLESFKELHRHLKENGLDPGTIPTVLQYNKRDIKGVLAIEELDADLNPGNLPFFEAIAKEGVGVEDTLRCVSKLVLKKLMGQMQETQQARVGPPAVRPKAPPEGGVIMDQRKLLTELGIARATPGPEAAPPTPPPQPREEEVVLTEAAESAEVLLDVGESPLLLDDSGGDLLAEADELPLAAVQADVPPAVEMPESLDAPCAASPAELTVLDDPPALATDSRRIIKHVLPPVPAPVPAPAVSPVLLVAAGKPMVLELQAGEKRFQLTIKLEEI